MTFVQAQPREGGRIPWPSAARRTFLERATGGEVEGEGDCLFELSEIRRDSNIVFFFSGGRSQVGSQLGQEGYRWSLLGALSDSCVAAVCPLPVRLKVGLGDFLGTHSVCRFSAGRERLVHACAHPATDQIANTQ